MAENETPKTLTRTFTFGHPGVRWRRDDTRLRAKLQEVAKKDGLTLDGPITVSYVSVAGRETKATVSAKVKKGQSES